MDLALIQTLAYDVAWLAIALMCYYMGRIIGTARGYTLAKHDFRLFLGAILLASRNKKNPNLFFFKKIKEVKNA